MAKRVTNQRAIDKILLLSSYVLLIANVAITWSALVQAGRPASTESLDWYLFGVPLAIWSALPSAALAAAVRGILNRTSRTTLLAAATLITSGTVYFWKLGALTDLTFIFLPLWECAGVALIVLLALWQSKRPEVIKPREGEVL